LANADGVSVRVAEGVIAEHKPFTALMLEKTMGRQRRSALKDILDLLAMLPWQAGVALSVVSYLGFHYMAGLPPLVATDMKAFGPMLTRQMAITGGMLLQYIAPLVCLFGAVTSALLRRRSGELHDAVAASPSRETLEGMSWSEFESLVAEAYRRKGYTVTPRGGNGPDGGVDVELRQGKDKYLVQCKQWKARKVGVAPVRELYGVMAAERAVGGFVVTSGDFTEEAMRFAEGRSIKLVQAEGLLRLVSGDNPTPHPQPRQSAASPACPKCGSPMVLRRAKHGEQAGSSFWGCSRYPGCRGIRNTA
jgi:restriction system protein